MEQKKKKDESENGGKHNGTFEQNLQLLYWVSSHSHTCEQLPIFKCISRKEKSVLSILLLLGVWKLMLILADYFGGWKKNCMLRIAHIIWVVHIRALGAKRVINVFPIDKLPTFYIFQTRFTSFHLSFLQQWVCTTCEKFRIL